MWLVRFSLRLAIPVILGFSLLIGAAMVVGSGMPSAPSAATAIGNNPCTLPCVYGITPGTTNRLTAFEAVDHIALNSNFLTMTRTSFTLPDSVLGLLTFDRIDEDATVSSVGLWGMSTRIDAIRIGSFSDLLQRGWLPERVFLTCSFMPDIQMYIIMNEGRVLTRILLKQLGTDAPVLSFTIYSAPGAADRFMDANVECMLDARWIGFAPWWRYLQAVSGETTD